MCPISIPPFDPPEAAFQSAREYRQTKPMFSQKTVEIRQN
jgi:hypothetical protein